jgi:flagellar hook assembly protein FlgD
MKEVNKNTELNNTDKKLQNMKLTHENYLIGKKVIWKGKEYTIVDKHNDSDFVMIDDENNSVIGLHWNNVELVD